MKGLTLRPVRAGQGFEVHPKSFVSNFWGALQAVDAPNGAFPGHPNDPVLYLIPGASQDDLDDGVDVGDVDFAIIVHVSPRCVTISA